MQKKTTIRKLIALAHNHKIYYHDPLSCMCYGCGNIAPSHSHGKTTFFIDLDIFGIVFYDKNLRKKGYYYLDFCSEKYLKQFIYKNVNKLLDIALTNGFELNSQGEVESKYYDEE